MVTNAKLHEASRVMAIKGIELINDGFNPEDIRENETRRFVPFGDPPNSYGFTIETQNTPDFSLVIHKKRGAIVNSREFCDVEQIMRNDSQISKQLDHNVGMIFGLWQPFSTELMMSDILTRLLTKNGKPEYCEQTYKEAYRIWETFLYSDDITSRVITPLSAFASDIDIVDFGNGMQLRKPDPDEFGVLGQRNLVHIPEDEFNGLRYVLEFEIKSKKVILPLYYKMQDVMNLQDVKSDFASTVSRKGDTFLFLLRLFRNLHDHEQLKSDVRTYWICHKQNLPLLPDFFLYGPTTRRRILGFDNINGANITEFRTFYESHIVSASKAKDPLSIAIRKFNSAYEREAVVDKLIDLVVAIEALLNDPSESTETLYRLSTRLAKCLEIDTDKRKEVANEFRSIYKLRSKLIHTGNPSKGQTSIDDSISKSYNYVARIIQFFLEKVNASTQKDVIDMLDFSNQLF